MKWHLGAALIVGLFGGCDKAGELGKTKDAGDESDGDAGGDEATDSTTQAPTDTATDPNGGLCEGFVAESMPVKVTITCKPGAEKLTEIKLEPAPNPDTIRVFLDGEEIAKEAFAYESDTGLLQILDEVAPKEIKITYTGTSVDGGTPGTSTKATGRLIDATGLDGCGLLIELEDGKRLEPLNFPKDMAFSGLKVEFSYVVVDDASSVCMAGTIVNVSDVKSLGKSEPDEAKCTEARKKLSDALTELNKQPKTCIKDEDCLLLSNASDGCLANFAIAKEAYDSEHGTIYAEGRAGVDSYCAAPILSCNSFPANAVRCVNAVCSGVFE